MAKNTYAIMHESVKQLMDDFLDYKRNYGTDKERNLYINMTRDQFVERLLTKRPIVFYTSGNKYLTRNGAQGQGMNLTKIGTSQEHKDFSIRNYITAEEAEISALLGMSNETVFINNGSRANCGVNSEGNCELVSMEEAPSLDTKRINIKSNAAYIFSKKKLYYVNKANDIRVELNLDKEALNKFVEEMKPTKDSRTLTTDELAKITNLTQHTREEDKHEQEGVYVGLVGARFEEPHSHEYRYMAISKSQNTKSNGYGENGERMHAKNMAHFAKYYGVDYFPTYEEVESDFKKNKEQSRYIQVTKDNEGPVYLDKEIYKKRMQVTTETFLNEANARGKIAGKGVYAHVVGLGLGVWELDQRPNKNIIQAQIFLETFVEALKKNQYSNISDLDFSYFPDKLQEYFNDNLNKFELPDNINIVFSKRNPADKLTGKGKLLVAQYAWDGNSYPGNEFWLGALSASGDPAAICCSTVGITQIPLLIQKHVLR